MKFILEKKIYDSDKLQCIYSDGRFSSRGEDIYVTKDKKLIEVPWSQWQGERPKARFITMDEFLEYKHYERVIEGIEKAGLKVEEGE